MGKVVAGGTVSLDGYIAGPNRRPTGLASAEAAICSTQTAICSG